MKKYENLSLEIEIQINNKIKELKKRKNIITEKEIQYLFIRFLDTLPLTRTEVFDVYTNTEL